MRRRHGIRTCLIVAGIFALFAGPTFAGGTVKLQGTGATAFFRGDDGCIVTSVFVIARADTQSFAPSEQQRSLVVDVNQVDLCGGFTILAGSGLVYNATVIVTPNLDSAAVSAVVPVLNLANGQLVHVSVDLRFTATSPMTSETGQEWDPDGSGAVAIFHSNSRTAIAAGSIATESGELVGDLVEAEIHDVRVVDR